MAPSFAFESDSAEPPVAVTEPPPVCESITAEELEDLVTVLASQRFSGRQAGTPGGKAAAKYLANQLKKIGVAPAGDDGGYFQRFNDGWRNVLGKIEGSDPELKDEIIIVSGHYDHVGMGDKGGSRGTKGKLHGGADDNASGTAAVLETAEAFMMLGQPPKRTVLFVFWDGEEKGLVGSKHWASRPTVPIEKISAVVVADMLGHVDDEPLLLFGTRTMPGMRRLVSDANSVPNVLLDLTWNLPACSDHWPFVCKEIPVVLLHSGMTDDYHTERDTADSLDYDGAEKAGRLMFQTARALADLDEIPEFRCRAREESEAQRKRIITRSSAAPQRLGLHWDTKKEFKSGEGIRVTVLRDDLPAAQAGIQIGDVLMTFDGRPIESREQFLYDVMVCDKPECEIGLLRDGEETTISVALAEKALPLGLWLRTDDAEPEVLIIANLVQGSPAADAGLAVGDRIYAVDGVPCGTVNDLRLHLNESGEQVELLIEKNGQLRTVQLPN